MAFKLSEEESISLNKILAKYSENANYSITLDLLLDKWQSFVFQVESGYSDSIYEYQNDLSTRTILQEIINKLGEPLGMKLSDELRSWDERFMGATLKASKPLHPDLDIEKHPWISRLPKVITDELRDDLLVEGYL